MKIMLRFGWFSEEILEESIEGLREWVECANATGILLASRPPRGASVGFVADPADARLRLERGLGCEILLDRTAAAPLLPGFIPDPAWDSPFRASRASYWKLHGWHPDRWVRRYGEAQLAAVSEKILKARPNHVCLAHSGRFEELGVLALLVRRGQ